MVLAELSGTIKLEDGQSIAYRHIEPGDAPALQRFHATLSERSVYMRFFEVMPHLSEKQAAYFTGADGEDRIAVVAIDPDHPGELIGVVRIDRDPGTNAGEYAAIVTDRWQGKGIGSALTSVVIDAARARGITKLYALVLPGNAPMLSLLHDVGVPERHRWEDNVERVELTIG